MTTNQWETSQSQTATQRPMDPVTHMTFQLVGSTLKEKIDKVKQQVWLQNQKLLFLKTGNENKTFTSFINMLHFLHLSLTYRPVGWWIDSLLVFMFDQNLESQNTGRHDCLQRISKQNKRQCCERWHLRGLFSLTWKKKQLRLFSFKTTKSAGERDDL